MVEEKLQSIDTKGNVSKTFDQYNYLKNDFGIYSRTMKITLNAYYGISKGIQTNFTDSQTFFFSLKSIEMIYGSTSSLLDMNSAK